MSDLTSQDAIEIVASALGRVAEDFDEPWSFGGPQTVVMGDGGLSSLAIVAAIVEAEQEVEDRVGRPVELSSDALLSETRSPLATVLSFAEFIVERVEAGPG